MEKTSVRHQSFAFALAAVLAVVGIMLASASVLWLTGTLGVSAVAANAIANAVEVGSWGMFLAAIATSGGLVGAAMWGALKLMMKKAGKAAVVA